MHAPLLDIQDLSTHFLLDEGVGKAVDGVSLAVGRGENVAVVGESGCGKTMLALSVMRLVPRPGRIVGGRVLLHGRDLLALSEAEMRGVRGNHLAMIFQEPMTSLNPVFRVGEQIAEGLRLHRGLDKHAALDAAVELLGKVGIPDPAGRARSYPHELSGGMRQRVMIAMALSCDPELILADEPTTALDVTIQAEILELLRELAESRGLSQLLITHDLGVVAETCSRVAVMYSGKIVEHSGVQALFDDPLHPYTRGLLGSLPRPGLRGGPLAAIPGTVPGLLSLPSGCHFHPRCPESFARCPKERPPLYVRKDGRQVRCFLYDE